MEKKFANQKSVNKALDDFKKYVVEVFEEEGLTRMLDANLKYHIKQFGTQQLYNFYYRTHPEGLLPCFTKTGVSPQWLERILDTKTGRYVYVEHMW